MTTNELLKKLSDLDYPCYLIVYGPQRNYRSNYRGEHHGVFGSDFVNSPKNAIEFIEGVNYPGHYSEMTIRAIVINNGKMEEKEISYYS